MLIPKAALLIFATILFCLPKPALTADMEQHTKQPAESGIQLSAELKNLVNQEMAAIQQGMMDLIPAIAAGNWPQVASIGKNIKASYIMKQKLTQAQKEELRQTLPAAFIEQDQAFHNAAGMLAHVAEKHNAELVNFYFYKLNEGCVSCHSKYAPERFPGLNKKAAADQHHH